MEINEIIEKSIQLDKSMPKRMDNPDGLSMAIAEMGMLRSLLGNQLARLEKEYSHSKNELSFTEAKMKKKLLTGTKMAVNKAELEIDTDDEIKSMRDELVDKQYVIRLISVKRDDLKTAMDGYRSRLAFIREEIK